MLAYLLTDAWVPPSSLLAKICGRGSNLAERFHDTLPDARVKAFNSSLIVFEMLARTRRLEGWTKIIARNGWFQRKVVSFLRSQVSTIDYQPTLLSYSYTALEPFRYAKAHGWKTLLVQIDPGPEEEAIVAREAACVRELAAGWQPAPSEYWALWREECKLADRIAVNSEWSREALVRRGVSAEKISVIPLAYETPEVRIQESEVRGARSYPARFTQERPIRVLFLGLINLRKGAARLLEAARILRDEPVEFWMVGPVTRNQGSEFYRDADVFILPTLSDGFGITQLEAQAHGLPVIASKFCGEVVDNGLDGIVLEEPTAACIAAAVRDCIADTDRLQKLAAASRLRDEFTIQALAKRLQKLGTDLRNPSQQ